MHHEPGGAVWYAWERVSDLDLDREISGWHRVRTVFYLPESCQSWTGMVMAADASEIFTCEPEGTRPELPWSSSPSR